MRSLPRERRLPAGLPAARERRRPQRPGQALERRRDRPQRHAVPPGAPALSGDAAPPLDPPCCFVSATKGLENGTLLRISEVIREVVCSPASARAWPSFPARPSPAKWPAATPPPWWSRRPTLRLAATSPERLFRPDLPALHQLRSGRRRDWRRRQERGRHRRRRLPRPGPGPQRHGRADHTRPGRNHPAGGGDGRPAARRSPAWPGWATWC